MNQRIIRYRRVVPVEEKEMTVQPTGSIFYEVNLNWLDGIQGFVPPTLHTRFFINPRFISRYDKSVIIQQQQPHRLFKKFACSHKRIRIFQHLLNRAVIHRHRITAVVPDVLRIQFFHLINYTFQRLLHHIRRIYISAKL